MDNILSAELERQKKKLSELVTAAKSFISLQAITVEDLVKQKNSFDVYINNFVKTLDRYVTNIPSPSEELACSCYEIIAEGQEILIEFSTLIETHRSNFQPSSKTTRLPQLTLPTWGGDILEFNQFLDRFQSSVGSQNISEVDKLAYLLGCLEGSALQAVQGIATTNINYSVAIETLQKRFGDKSLLIDAHYKALSKLSQCKYDADECRNIFNSIEKHLRILESLGEDINSNHLRSIILDKFPEKVLYEVSLLCPMERTVAHVKQELNKIITAMERSRIKHSEILPASTSSSTEVLQVHQTSSAKEKVIPFRRMQRFDNKKRKFEDKKSDNDNRHRGNVKKRRQSCIFCSGAHYNDQCTVVKSVKDREKKLKNRCFNCFNVNHRIRDCRRQKSCYYCKGPHNRALCPEPKKIKSMPLANLESQVLNNIQSSIGRSTSILQTATAWVTNNNNTIKCRVLLDCGSQRSYVTQALAKHMNLTPEGEDLLTIYTFGEDKPKETLSPSVTINLETRRGVHRSISVNVVPHITDRLPIPSYESTDLVDMWADDGSAGNRIELLIGNDYYFSFLKNKTISMGSNLYLVNTEFGWVVSGCLNRTKNRNDDVLSVVTYHQACSGVTCFTEPDIPLRNMDINFLWSLENIGITDPIKASREEEAVQHFNKTCEYRGGRYYVKWPWIKYPPNLPTNFGVAYGRLKGLLQRQDRSTLKEYDETLNTQLKAGIIERIEVQTDPTYQRQPPVHYLPHHMVKQAGKSGRIVYDASAKLKEQLSLNECMFRGPCLLQDLTSLLLNFRVHKVAIVADVEKAFLQVGLQEEDREVTRFLWVKDIKKPLSNDNIVHLRFCRVPFGIIASPFLLTSVIRYHISSRARNLLDCIADKFYVDNLITGASSTAEAIHLFETCKKIFDELSMNLRDWSSNDQSFMAQIPKEHRLKQKEEEKVLGLIWEKKEDIMRLNINEENLMLNNKRICKREVLRTLASIYDPCGITSPLILSAKLFLQKLWLLDYKWDMILPAELIKEWETIVSELRKIKDITVPRYVGATCMDKEKTDYELHCFSDSSTSLYSSVVYLRVEEGHNVKTVLLMSKCRVVPLEKEKSSKAGPVKKNRKTLTIPQLELLGFLIGSRLLAHIKKTITLPISHSYLWTDSMIVLSWVKSDKLLTPWVANRVTEIRKNVVEMRYVNTKQNPADMATRPGVDISKMKTMWLQGPDFLSESKEKWPQINEEDQLVSVVAEGLEEPPPDNQPHAEQEKPAHEINANNSERTVSSEVQKIKTIQKEYFPDEVNGRETHLSRNLDLFKDIDGILRCGGRMLNTDWTYEMKHPILLPKDCVVTNKIITDTHKKNYHVGVSHTLSLIRRMYWIPQGRSQVQKVLKRCPQCVKYGGGPYKLPSTPALPPERVRYEAPFAYVGLDYLGPILVKSVNGKEKRWICLYTCLVVRSVHLEVVKDLTSEECLSAFRRFVATRVIPKHVLSDNALQFKLTAEVLTSSYCIENNIKWRFTPELAPWHGGVYERLVAVVKECLKRSLEKHLLNDTQLSTVIKEVEAVINTRPLTCVTSDQDYILRPADFLSLGNCLTSSIDADQGVLKGSSTKQDLIASWKLGLNLRNEFKEMFIGRYLTNLRERYRHSPKQPRIKTYKEPCVGDLVQIKGEHKNRQNWKVGRISSLVKGADGECRVAKIKVGDAEFTRSIGHLYPLEADIEQGEPVIRNVVTEPEVVIPEMGDLRLSGDELSEPMQGRERVDEVEQPPAAVKVAMDVEEDVPLEDRPRRVAALRAREKIKEWTRMLLALF